MRRLQFVTLLLLSFCFIAELSAAEEVSRCNVIPKISSNPVQSEIKFKILKDNEEINILSDIEVAIKTACQMQKNNECFYSSACK